MNSLHTKRENDERCQGFAVIIALSLMSFIVLLLLSMTTLVQVETQTASITKDQLKARQNALLGAYIALGNLQKYAGPDQRVTATASLEDTDPATTEIEGVGAGRQHWTGVWNTDDTASGPSLFDNGSPVWLVSGVDTEDTDPLNRVFQDEITMISATALGASATLADETTAGIVPITGPADEEVGTYAWWVADEGVKAKINMLDPLTDSILNEEQIRRAEIALRSAPETINGLSSLPVSDARYSRVNDFADFMHMTADESVEELLRTHFNSLTANSQGVLAGTTGNGIKRDLTRGLSAGLVGGQIGSSSAEWSGAVDYFNTAGLNTLTPSNGFMPILIGVEEWVGLSAEVKTQNTALPPAPSNATYGICLSYYSRIVLWNPYDKPLNSQTYEFSSEYPTVMVRRLKHPSGSPFPFKNMRDYLDNSGQPIGDDFMSFTTSMVSFEPGEIKVLSIRTPSSNAHYGSNISLDPAVSFNGFVTLRHPDHTSVTEGDLVGWEWLPQTSSSLSGGVPERYARFHFGLSGEQPQLRVGRNVFGGGWPAGIPYTIPTPPAAVPPGDTGPSVGIRNTYTQQFTRKGWFEPRLAEINRLGIETAPLIAQNLRGSNGSSGGYASPDDVTKPNARRSWTDDWDSDNDVFSQSNFQLLKFDTDAAGNGFSWWGSSRRSQNGGSESAGNRTVLLFDIPNEAPLSIGSLRHALISEELDSPTYIVGNSFVDLNNLANQDIAYQVNDALWDDYFFSSVPDNLTQIPTVSAPLPNPKMTPTSAATAAGLTDFRLAGSQLTVDGAFNINSTSLEAWQALLASTNGVLTHPDNSAATIVIPRVTPDTPAANDFNLFYTSEGFSNTAVADENDPRMKLWTGNRVLQAAEIRLLAQEIVEQVKTRGPFNSLADFVNRDPSSSNQQQVVGTLQAAIDNVRLSDDPSLTPQTYPDFGTIVGDNVLVRGIYDGLNRSVARNDFRGGSPDQRHGGLTLPTASVQIEGVNYRYPISADAPGFLNQHDLLELIGPRIQNRSDTFKIRTFGSSNDRLSGDASSKAWLEATVQRIPELVDDGSDIREDATGFGRRFVITSIKWMQNDEI